MSAQKYNKLTQELKQDLREEASEENGYEIIHEIATDIVNEEKWITTYLNSIGVSDVMGRFASDIA